MHVCVTVSGQIISYVYRMNLLSAGPLINGYIHQICLLSTACPDPWLHLSHFFFSYFSFRHLTLPYVLLQACSSTHGQST